VLVSLLWLGLPEELRRRGYERTARTQRYHQRRNARAKASHAKRRRRQLHARGIRLTDLPSCFPRDG
jgi:hypothetical protein